MVEFIVIPPRKTYWKLLRAVVENEGLTTIDLVKRFNVSRHNIATELRSLQRLGYVRIVGARRYHYYPTEKAMRKFGR